MSGRELRRRSTGTQEIDDEPIERHMGSGKPESLKEIMWRVTEETRTAISEAVAKELKKPSN